MALVVGDCCLNCFRGQVVCFGDSIHVPVIGFQPADHGPDRPGFGAIQVAILASVITSAITRDLERCINNPHDYLVRVR